MRWAGPTSSDREAGGQRIGVGRPPVDRGTRSPGSPVVLPGRRFGQAAPVTVLHVITRMVKGGAQENTLATVLHADPARFRSILVTGLSEGPEGSLLERARACGVDVRLVSSLRREIAPLADARALRALIGIMRRERPTIVHTHTSKAGVLGRVAARIARVHAVVHTPHGHVFHSYFGGLETRALIAVERFCARYADRLVMLTENERKDHLGLRIASVDKFTVIHSGVDFRRFLEELPARHALRDELGIPGDARVIGTVGRLVPIKGQRHLIAAMPLILRSVPNARLLLVGGGPLRESLEDQAQRLGVERRIHFAGLREDVADCLASFDVFCLPSLNEGMGRAIVEAMALRLPVVASDVSGIRDLVQSERNGLLVPAAQPDAIAAACARVLLDDGLAAQLGDAGHDTVVPAWSLENMIARIERLYGDLLEESETRRHGHREVRRHMDPVIPGSPRHSVPPPNAEKEG